MFKKTIIAVVMVPLFLMSTETLAKKSKPKKNYPVAATTVTALTIDDSSLCMVQAVSVSNSWVGASDEEDPIFLNGAASANAFALAKGYLQTVVRGNIDLGITRRGRRGDVREIELNAKINHATMGLLVSQSLAAAEANSGTFADALEEADSDAFKREKVWIPYEGWRTTDETAEEIGVEATGYALANADSGAVGAAGNETSFSSENNFNSEIYVKGKNIKNFEATLQTENAFNIKSSSIAIQKALVDAYAIAFYDADFDVEARTRACAFVQYIDGTCDHESEFNVSEEEIKDMSIAAAESQAEAIASMLVDSKFKFTVKAHFARHRRKMDTIEVFADARGQLDCQAWVHSATSAARLLINTK
jgi:hypothetical protein